MSIHPSGASGWATARVFFQYVSDPKQIVVLGIERRDHAY